MRFIVRVGSNFLKDSVGLSSKLHERLKDQPYLAGHKDGKKFGPQFLPRQKLQNPAPSWASLV